MCGGEYTMKMREKVYENGMDWKDYKGILKYVSNYLY